MFTRYLNVVLRLITLGTRFLFVIALAKFLDPAQLGLYGLFTVAISYTMYFVGLDFYTYVTREILKRPVSERGIILKSQLALSGLLYLFVLPVAICLLIFFEMPINLIFWFLPILLLEHLNQEISRLLVALSQQVTASVVLFVRHGSWAIFIVVIMTALPEGRSLEVVMALWAGAGLLAAALGIWTVARLGMGGWRSRVDWLIIRQGVGVSAGLLVATIALRSLQTFDRFLLGSLGGLEIVGAYVLFMGIAATLLTFLDAGVFAFTYPSLIQHNHLNENEIARKLLRKTLFQTIIVSTVFATLSLVALPHLLDWLENPVYSENVWLYRWLLGAMIVNAIGLVPHYGLYARGHDKPIIASHIAALAAFVAATAVLSSTLAELAVPVGLNLAFLVILIWKTIAYVIVTNKPTKTEFDYTP